jgi:succinate dehydrogenase/fumarate reductase flavoprotein subunit
MMSDQFSPDAAAGDIGLRPIPVTVIGGGIGGLSVALSLLDAGAVAAADITIVDAIPVSGRLHT